MEAICKADFEKRENARMDAELEVERLKKEGKPIDGVAIHRFAAHPIHRPVMFLRGRELETHPVQITGPRIVPNDIRIELPDT